MKLKKRILSACTGAAILLSAFSGLSVSAANVEETPGIQLQTILADNNGTNLWTTQIWGGEHILLNPIWTATDLQDYYYNGNLTFEVKSNSTCNFDREQNFTKILHEKTTADRLI